ncbi:MAG: AAA family ATPase, partial [Kiritimatiellae bacterium]|nr:AAA family ATPase [Kiritimatiellia bacterium]
MYLKQLDVIGFKSFADKTRLTFEPGLTAIVGPNGCGKSNVSDAIRWVLGEQKPTALRCSKLVDVVFNGTDTRKPLGLAEVSITFADCEKELGTDYHEVTVTRRVYRDGSGEYFINKQQSRLKDVQHLFMGTGIGTSSYSVMAQGQIDAILSSRPEDRRAVFEEAAGITKFKADRKEALRKIEQTEQNLLREADVLREMKRQIASLQRQVGKAKRYKELRDSLRGVDIFVSKRRIHDFDQELEQNAANRNEIDKAIAEAQEAVSGAEARAQALHQQIHELEERLQTLASQQAAAEGEYRRANEVIGVNAQRVAEYKAFADRDRGEIEGARRALEDVRMQAESLEQKTALLTDSLAAARGSLEESEAAFAESQQRMDELRSAVQSARSESVRLEREANERREELIKLRLRHEQDVVEEEESVSAVIGGAGDSGRRLLDCVVVADACRDDAEAALGGL